MNFSELLSRTLDENYKAIGLMPIYVSAKATSSPSLLWKITGITYMIICLTIYILSFTSCLETTPTVLLLLNYPKISVVGHYIHIFSGNFVAFFCYLYTIKNLKGHQIFYKNLSLLDNELNSICVKEQFDNNAIFKFHLYQITFGIAISVVIMLFDVFIFYGLFGYYVVLIIFAYVYPFLSTGCVQLHFISCVHNIYHRFKMINKLLELIAKVNEPTSRAAQIYRIQNTNLIVPTISETIESEDVIKKNKLKKAAWTEDKINVESDSTIEASDEEDEAEVDESLKNLHYKMNELFTIHDKLCDLSEFINKAFGVQIVVYVTIAFIITLFGFFFETKVIFWELGGTFSKLVLVASSYVLWGLLASMVTYFMLSACTAAREEANESALIIHKILQNKPAFMLNDEIYYNKMKSFTLQVLHRKNTFQFHGLGLFSLDYTFIFSVVAAATSYLIVLLQFDMSADFTDSFAAISTKEPDLMEGTLGM